MLLEHRGFGDDLPVGPMTPEDVRAALAGTPLAAAETVEPLGGGWFSWTFAVDEEWVVRFPRDDDVARRHSKERALLPALAARSAFAVPCPSVAGEWRGRPFFGYRRVPGEAMRCDEIHPEQFANLLLELHGFPVDEARRLLGAPGTAASWVNRYEQLRSTAETRVRPLLGDELATALDRAFHLFATTMGPMSLTLVHGDLELEHVLVSPQGLGLIDFEYATVGDPVLDFIGLWLNCGAAVTEAVAACYGQTDEHFWTRLKFYSAMGALHAILYSIDHDDLELRQDASSRLAERLAGLDSAQ